MKYDHILWDFNGTILDDVETGIRAVNTLLFARALPVIRSKEQYRSLFRFPIIEYYRSLGFDFEKESYTALADLWVAEYNRNLPFASVNPGVRELIGTFRKLKLSQSVLSASESGMLRNQLASLGLTDCFAEIVGSDNVLAYGKTALARAFRERHPGERFLLIGDTDHDAETAKEAGFDCVLVAAGHQPEVFLRSLPYPVFPDFHALKEHLSEVLYG